MGIVSTMNNIPPKAYGPNHVVYSFCMQVCKKLYIRTMALLLALSLGCCRCCKTDGDDFQKSDSICLWATISPTAVFSFDWFCLQWLGGLVRINVASLFRSVLPRRNWHFHLLFITVLSSLISHTCLIPPFLILFNNPRRSADTISQFFQAHTLTQASSSMASVSATY